MFFNRLSLTNFRNYENASFSFQRKINCIVGKNGTGKTNLLDAIYYLCLTKSYLNNIDLQNIRHGEGFFTMEGDFSINREPFMLRCAFSPERNKEFLKNGVKYEKLSEHVGLFPVVFITPYDISLVQGGSEERRRFLDGFISQLDHEYLNELQQYNRLLTQRNALLKNTEDRRRLNKPLLQVYNEKMIPLGNYIFETRKRVVEEFIPVFNTVYQLISGDKERTSLAYCSELEQTPFQELLQKNTEKDIAIKRTSSGIHRDDIDFLMEEQIIRRFGSQGQQKSFLVAVKLAQYQLLKKHKAMNPLLLLDDIFDKLDKERSANLLEFISGDEFGQIFISNTQRERIETVFEDNMEEVAILDMNGFVAEKILQAGEE